MNRIDTAMKEIKLGEPIEFKNMTILPLSGSPREVDYLTLDEALAAATVEVTEVTEGGRVPNLRVNNKGHRPVLIVDGEELLGAKQNRIVNITILVPAKAEVIIPVSCVEAGRWARHSPRFVSSPQAYYSSGRAMKLAQVSSSLKLSGTAHSDQGEVWNDISRKMFRLKSMSSTSAMSAMFEDYSGRLDAYVAGFQAAPDHVGAVFMIDGGVVGMELFDAPATFAKLLPKLMRSYAIDAIDSAARSETKIDSRTFLEKLREAQETIFKAAGEGEDLRLGAADLVGAALLARDRIVHLSAFTAGYIPASKDAHSAS